MFSTFRIKNNSASLVQDLKMRNMKLANYPWLKSRQVVDQGDGVGEEGGCGDPFERVTGQTEREGDSHQPWCEGSQT